MNFLALVIALLFRYTANGEPAPDRGTLWWRWLAWCRQRGLGPWLELLLAVGLPVLLVAWGMALLAPLLFGLPWLAVAVWLLLYSFGRGDFRASLQRYRELCAAGNAEGAWLHARQSLDLSPALEAEDFPGLQGLVQIRLCYEGYQRWFAVIFWFLLLGPAAALCYRLLQWYSRELASAPALRLLFIVDWVPVRLLALAFALAGDFLCSRASLGDGMLDPRVDHEAWLGEVAAAASGAGPTARTTEAAADSIDALGGLLERSAVVWIAVIAVLAIFG